MSSQEQRISTFRFSSFVKFGRGALIELAPAVQRVGAKKVLVVADKGVAEAGILAKVTGLLDEAKVKYETFTAVQANPTDANVEAGVERYRAAGCDLILAVGGGSPIDAAKGIQVVSAHPGKINQYFMGPGSSPITLEMAKLIAIPTTAGTGSEVTGVAVITETATNRKRFVSPGFPYLAIIDPALTVTMPPQTTAATGMDALTHCIEAYVSNRYSPVGDAVAIAGVKLIGKTLREAVRSGANLEARADMSMGAMMGGAAFGMLGKGLGAAHSLAHQLSTEIGLSHGEANAIVLPHVMRFYLESVLERYGDVAQALGVHTWNMPPMRAAEAAVEAVVRLSKEVGIPQRLRDAGLKKGSIGTMAKNAMLDGAHFSGPRPCIEENMRSLFEAAF